MSYIKLVSLRMPHSNKANNLYKAKYFQNALTNYFKQPAVKNTGNDCPFILCNYLIINLVTYKRFQNIQPLAKKKKLIVFNP